MKNEFVLYLHRQLCFWDRCPPNPCISSRVTLCIMKCDPMLKAYALTHVNTVIVYWALVTEPVKNSLLEVRLVKSCRSNRKIIKNKTGRTDRDDLHEVCHVVKCTDCHLFPCVHMNDHPSTLCAPLYSLNKVLVSAWTWIKNFNNTVVAQIVL